MQRKGFSAGFLQRKAAEGCQYESQYCGVLVITWTDDKPLLSELMPGPGTNKWGPDTRQTTPSIMVIPGINNLRAQLGGCIELSIHKTSVKCGHINTDTDKTTS